jgi:hypothetical protein
MYHRTYGETKDCAGCRFWSEMLARCNGGPIEAMCLNKKSKKYQKYVTATIICESWESGEFGAVDELY